MTKKKNKLKCLLSSSSLTQQNMETCLYQNWICLWNKSLNSNIYWHMQISHSTIKLLQCFSTGFSTEELLFGWLHLLVTGLWNNAFKAGYHCGIFLKKRKQHITTSSEYAENSENPGSSQSHNSAFGRMEGVVLSNFNGTCNLYT